MNVINAAAFGIYEASRVFRPIERWLERRRDQRAVDDDILSTIAREARGVGHLAPEAWDATGELPVVHRMVIDNRQDRLPLEGMSDAG